MNSQPEFGHDQIPFVQPHRRAFKTRLIAALAIVPTSVILILAAWLQPDPAGIGTHKQLGTLLGQHPLPPCTTIAVFGYPCPTCGMTTSFAYAIRARFISAFLTQPAGLLFALLTVAVCIGSLFVLITGRPIRIRHRWLSPAGVAIALLTILIIGWAFKLIDGLINGTLPVRP